MFQNEQGLCINNNVIYCEIYILRNRNRFMYDVCILCICNIEKENLSFFSLMLICYFFLFSLIETFHFSFMSHLIHFLFCFMSTFLSGHQCFYSERKLVFLFWSFSIPEDFESKFLQTLIYFWGAVLLVNLNTFDLSFVPNKKILIYLDLKKQKKRNNITQTHTQEKQNKKKQTLKTKT